MSVELAMNDELPLKEGTKSENLTERLIEEIVEGRIESGSKISEPELAKRFEVSRGLCARLS
ncbi:propionate catabolism operon transcriptional regulator of GntR family [Vibrio maritimus]|uniref:Propionate catabolism operon transcriptional regulator of GntR family n=1 Tax=Vibrio maritimus TaxID=990268 RepID=A0A090RV03_9VIBR|nr:propionate catabolism operon transcriptional regulator of GntR family [Vibrio maritimus]